MFSNQFYFWECPVYHYFDVSTGHCERSFFPYIFDQNSNQHSSAFYPNDCAQFFNFDSSTVESELTLTVKPSKSARLENISASRHVFALWLPPFQMTHLLVYQGCKATIDGGYVCASFRFRCLLFTYVIQKECGPFNLKDLSYKITQNSRWS